MQQSAPNFILFGIYSQFGIYSTIEMKKKKIMVGREF